MSGYAGRLGVCSWSLMPADAGELVRCMSQLGLSKVQLALVPVVEQPGKWGGVGDKLRGAGVEIVSGMLATIGEDYSSLDAIRRTGGIVPDEHWPANRELARKVADTAAAMGIPIVSFHAGFIPHDRADSDFAKLRDRLRTLADLYADAGLRLLLETGQETADDLLAFLDAVDKPNVAVNFDPANMILYDKGDPIAALRKLVDCVEQVHIKDAVRTRTPGQWGSEMVVGDGEVDWPAFLRVLDHAGYDGKLVIEREAGDDRNADIRTAARFISNLNDE